MGRYNDDETVRRRSGWLIPLIVFGLTFALSGAFLIYYLAPSRESFSHEQVAPTSRNDVVALSLGGKAFRIPANYLIYNSARSGGARDEIAIFALLPDLSGWSNWAANAFTDNAADSDVVYLTLKAKPSLSEADKLKRVWPDYIVDHNGSAGPYGLRQYAFRADSGYHNEDLFVGETEAGPVVLRCVRLTPEVPSPNCLREKPLAPGVLLSLRFKRAHLEAWREIAAKSDKLIASFSAKR